MQMSPRPTPPCCGRPFLAKFRKLKGARLRHWIVVRTQISNCALPGKNIVSRFWRDNRSRYASRSVYGEGRTKRVNGWCNINGGRKSATSAAFVIGAIDGVYLGKANPCEAGKNARSHPFASGINLARTRWDRNACAISSVG